MLDPLTAHRTAPNLADAGWMPGPQQRASEPAMERLVRRIVEKRIGLITLSCEHPTIRQIVEQTDGPVVDLGLGEAPRQAGRVIGDLEGQGYIAGRELAKRGYRRFVFYLNRPTEISRLRGRGLARAVEEVGGTLTELQWDAVRQARGFGFEDWEPWLVEQAGGLETPAAIVAVGDELAVHVLEACRAAGRMVPEQLAVVGFDNDPITCEHALVPLSSIDTNLEEIGYEAAALLDRLMDGEPIPDRPIVVPPKGLVVRHSSDLIAIEHPEVSRAVRYILAYYADPELTIADVVAVTDSSRRNLDRAFTRALGRTVAEELGRVRLEHARRLLVEAEMSIGEVATASGFSGRDHLRQTLQRETGLTPRAYREQNVPAPLAATKSAT